MSKQKSRVMFMHTLDGAPATYDEGRQIVFAQQGPYPRTRIRLASSVAQIKREQRASEAWRAAQQFNASFEHSYVRVEIPGDA